VENPTTSLADDVAVTTRVIAEQKSAVFPVGHSYGGAVITEAGTDPSVSGLLYITAFAPDRDESVASLIKDPPPDGFLALDKTKFAASFAADVESEKADFMANSQVPWGVAALSGAISEPAWKSKPSWYLVATDERMIPPAAQFDGQACRCKRRRGDRQPMRSMSRSRRRCRDHREGGDESVDEMRTAAPAVALHRQRRPAQ